MRLALLALVMPFLAHAQPIIKIETGKSYRDYSHAELQRRVWDLERAVYQLQARVFELEDKNKNPLPVPVAAADSWLCTVDERGNAHTGTGGSKAVATHKAMEACKAANKGDGFFCGTPKCSQ